MKLPPAYTAPAGGASPTLADALEALLAHVRRRVTARERAAGTLRMHEAHAGWLLERLGGDTPLLAIDAQAVEAFAAAEGAGRRGRPLNHRTLAKRLCTLRRAFIVARLQPPVFPEISGQVFRPAERILATFGEYQRLCAELPQHRAEAVCVAVWTVQRWSDVARMAWADLHDLDRPEPTMTIRSTKTKRPSRRVMCPPEMARIFRAKLARLRRAGAPPAPTDKLVAPWTNRHVQLAMACVRAGLLPLRPMDLRHTGLSWGVRNMGITPAAGAFGGTSEQMLARHYVHARRPELDAFVREMDSIRTEGRRGPRRAPTRRRRKAVA